jgi:general secretion pathway protein G
MKMQKMNRKRNGGFTLVELLVVMAILAMLVGLVGPAVMQQFGGAKSDAAKIQIEELGSALDLYKLDMGRYPNSGEGLAALVQKPSGGDKWNGPYLKKGKVPKDPWGNDFQYKAPGDQGRPYEIVSLGGDNAVGGEGENRDRHSWD